MNAHVVQVIPRPEAPDEGRSILALEREDPDEWSGRPPAAWVKLHVGVTLRTNPHGGPPQAHHREDWAWLDFASAGQAMGQMRKPGTSVMVLSTWTEVRRRRGLFVLRPTRCETLANLRWTARYDRRAAATALVSAEPGEEAVSKLLPRSRIKWRYEPRDRRSWELVTIRFVAPDDVDPGVGWEGHQTEQLRLL